MKTKVLPSIVGIGVIGAVAILWHFQVLQKLCAGHFGAGSAAPTQENPADEGESEKIIRLDEAAQKECGLEIATAGPG